MRVFQSIESAWACQVRAMSGSRFVIVLRGRLGSRWPATLQVAQSLHTSPYARKRTSIDI